MDTRRFGRFTFRVGAEGTGLACAFQRVMDAHARFVASPLSRVGNPLECEVVASSIFGTNTIEGGHAQRGGDPARPGPGPRGRAGRGAAARAQHEGRLRPGPAGGEATGLTNTVNLGSNATVAVAILGTPAFDATRVDPTSVTLASPPVRLKGRGRRCRARIQHFHPGRSTTDSERRRDGWQDLLVHVETSSFELSESAERAVLTGRTLDGIEMRGSDLVTVVP